MPKLPPLLDQLGEAQSTLDLPDEIFLQIGRLIAIFAALENMVSLIPATLLRITPMEGRIAVRNPRMKDCCEMIGTLVRVHEIKVTHNLTELATRLKDLEEMRDWFAHGIWAETKDGLGVRVLTGSWQPKGLKLPPGKNSIQRRVVPAVAPMTAQQIEEIGSLAKLVLPEIADLHDQIRVGIEALH